MHCQTTLFIKSAIALIEQNDPQLQTQLEIKPSVSHAEKDHRISCKKEFFSSPPLPPVPFFFPKTLNHHSWSILFSWICASSFVKRFSYHAHRRTAVEYIGMSHDISRISFQNNRNRLILPSNRALLLPASPRYYALSENVNRSSKSNSMCPCHESKVERHTL